MDVQNKNSLVPFVMLFILVGSSYANFSMKLSENEVRTICSKVSDPTLCVKFFESIPQIKTLNVSNVGEILIKYGSKDVTDISIKFIFLVKNTPDPHSKEIYEECLGIYEEAIPNFDKALKALEAKDYLIVTAMMSTMVVKGDICKQNLRSLQSSAELLRKMSDVNYLSEIVLEISHILEH